MSMYLSESVSKTQSSKWIASIFDAVAVLTSFTDLLAKALASQNTVRYIELATKVCGNTREVAFEVDFAVTAVGNQLFDMPDLLAEIERAQSAIETAHKLLLQVHEELASDDRIAKYAGSTGKRLERLRLITEEKSLISVYVRLWSDAHDGSHGLQDYNVALQTPHDGFCLTAAQWIAHRLGWVLSELKLESGPFFEALQQHQRFFCRQKAEFAQLASRLDESTPTWFVNEITKAITFELRISSDFDSVIQQDSLDEVTSQSIADDFHCRISRFLDGFQSSIEVFCAGECLEEPSFEEAIEFVETSSAQATGLGRALLIQEPNAPRKWSAVGLDFRCIGFGDTEELALASLEANIAVERQLNPNQKSCRLNRNTLSRFEEAEIYMPKDGNNKFSVHRSL